MAQGNLFQSYFHRIDGLTVIREMTRGHTKPDLCIDSHHRRWVRKLMSRAKPSGVVAEAITYCVGRAIGAPIPEIGLLNGPERGVLSALVLGVDPWTDDASAELVNVDGLARLVAIDAVMFNTDRKADNLLVQAGADGVRIFGIDHEMCLCGSPSDLETIGNMTPADLRARTTTTVWPNLASLPLHDDTLTAARSLMELDRATLRLAVHDVGGYAGFSTAACEMVATGLERRLDIAPELASRHLVTLGVTR